MIKSNVITGKKNWLKKNKKSNKTYLFCGIRSLLLDWIWSFQINSLNFQGKNIFVAKYNAKWKLRTLVQSSLSRFMLCVTSTVWIWLVWSNVWQFVWRVIFYCVYNSLICTELTFDIDLCWTHTYTHLSVRWCSFFQKIIKNHIKQIE